ncbi:MAG: NAD-dependent malic enzyme [Solirubrobacteraceae bacterium]|nr:NAD-dependent malic enzyme [Solirubrobacteraceae bacterium]
MGPGGPLGTNTLGPMASPSAQYSLTVRVEIPHRLGMLGYVAVAIGEAGGLIQTVDIVELRSDIVVRDITFDAESREHWDRILDAIRTVEGVVIVETIDRTFRMHVGGKIEMRNKSELRTRDDLSMAYTPGVARVCKSIHDKPDNAFRYTIKRNTVAVVSDGTAVLGLGDIGPRAAMPVMEGKAMLFKEFAGVDAFPICLDTKDPQQIIETVADIAPGFGGINLEDISAPRCFEIEDALKERLDIPVFHDDQHGTAVVVLAALLNALKLVDKKMEDLHVAVIGLGAAGVAVTKILQTAGVTSVVGSDSRGALSTERNDYQDGSMSGIKRWYAENSNPDKLSGGPNDILEGADLLIGLSGPGVIRPEALDKMNADAMVFAMANPDPEIAPEDAGPKVKIMATGRSDYPNQINNVLCFPGIFRGALDVRARQITDEMKVAAARGIASLVHDHELREDYIIPSVFNREVAPVVAAAVAEEARKEGVAEAGEHEMGYAAADAGHITGVHQVVIEP